MSGRPPSGTWERLGHKEPRSQGDIDECGQTSPWPLALGRRSFVKRLAPLSDATLDPHRDNVVVVDVVVPRRTMAHEAASAVSPRACFFSQDFTGRFGGDWDEVFTGLHRVFKVPIRTADGLYPTLLDLRCFWGFFYFGHFKQGFNGLYWILLDFPQLCIGFRLVFTEFHLARFD